MGEHFVLVDHEGRNGLDVGKFYALAVASGLANGLTNDTTRVAPVDREVLRRAALGWAPREKEKPIDVEFSAGLAQRVERWLVEVAKGPVEIRYEQHSPWGDWNAPDAAWGTLWTLYVHPVTDAAVPPWRLFGSDSRVEWVSRSLGRRLTPGEALTVQVVCDALQMGPWNVRQSWSTGFAAHGHGGRVVVHGDLSTVDQDHLTRLVFAAHDRCARVSVQQAGPRAFAICVWPRVREGGLARRHPTLEQAVADWRRDHEVPDGR